MKPSEKEYMIAKEKKDTETWRKSTQWSKKLRKRCDSDRGREMRAGAGVKKRRKGSWESGFEGGGGYV